MDGHPSASRPPADFAAQLGQQSGATLATLAGLFAAMAGLKRFMLAGQPRGRNE